MIRHYEVIVSGGGVSGAIAAIAAARAGVKTLIVEANGFLGGTLTAAGVGPMMTFHAGKKQAIQGITDELIQRLRRIGKSPGHIEDATNYTYSVTPFDAEILGHVVGEVVVQCDEPIDMGRRGTHRAARLVVVRLGQLLEQDVFARKAANQRYTEFSLQ